MTRRESREKAVCYLYEYACQPELSADTIVQTAVEERGETTSGFARMLFETVIDNLEEVDARISDASDNWSFKRINKVSLAILRLATAELCCLPEPTPDEIAVNEALELARLLDSEKAVPFINGVLAKVIQIRG
ncbi:MAG: transcription antitermination factor NusB [Clostridia bacterium]|nr:transcription antitermination factor NusB [Oscillospiraceae bacterium]MBQ8325301.1 transcription antitermination factor NusB [Clostridia bacterium]MBQ9132869.1 transcription antitermination factor NusB [Clostridia bacterium]